MTKNQFLKTETAKRWASIVASMDFEIASDTAVLAYMKELGVSVNAQEAAAASWKREGALRLLQILQTLTTPEQEAKAATWPEMVRT